MNITDWLAEADPTLTLHSEGEFSGMVGSDQWSAFNDGGIECETGEFLYGLIRLIKPENVLETGTHKGVGGCYMAKALEDNDKGHLTTIEFLPELFMEASKRFEDVGLSHRVQKVQGDVADYQTDVKFDIILLDTEPNLRFKELLQFYYNLKPGGFLFIHDLNRHMSQHPNEEHGFGWPFGKMPTEIDQLVQSRQLNPLHFTTPRGLAGFYKAHPEDYKWQISDI